MTYKSAHLRLCGKEMLRDSVRDRSQKWDMPPSETNRPVNHTPPYQLSEQVPMRDQSRINRQLPVCIEE